MLNIMIEVQFYVLYLRIILKFVFIFQFYSLMFLFLNIVNGSCLVFRVKVRY